MEIVSLTALFLTNTVKHMRLKTAAEVISTLQDNIINEIEFIFNEIEKIPKEKLSTKDDAFIPQKKWSDFKKQKWGYDCLVFIREVKNSLENTGLCISSKFVEDVKKYHKNDWQIKIDTLNYKFSEANYKKYKDYKKYEELSISKITMISDALITSFFEKNKAFYSSYIEWMRDIDNFFILIKNGETITFRYELKEYETLKNFVDDYNDLEIFDRKSFLDFISNVLSVLDDISKSRFSNGKVYKGTFKNIDSDEETSIRKDIENFYSKLFDYPEGTIGIVQDEIDNMFWMAANDVIESYTFLKEKKGLTWEKCQESKGFNALMRYRLYWYLSNKRVNEFITSFIKAMVTETENKYGIYISENAQIKNKVWIEENCKIGNCYIEDDVIIERGVNLMAEKVFIKSGSIVGPDVDIRGAIIVTISKGTEKSIFE